MARDKARGSGRGAMTTVSVLAAPPSQSATIDRLASDTLEREEAGRLYGAMLGDVCRAIERSGADLVIAVDPGEGDAEEADADVRERVEEALVEPEAVEYARQEGEDRPERLASEVLRLHETGATSAAVVEPSAAFLARTTVDSASMKLRSSEVVLGPTTEGRVFFAGFGEPMDLREALESPALESLADLASEDRSVDFLHVLPVIEGPDDLTTAIPLLRARVAAGRLVPERTAEVVAELGLAVAEREGDLTVVRETSS